jgi:hypothetical protein
MRNRRITQRLLLGSGAVFLVLALVLRATGQPDVIWGVLLFVAATDFLMALLFGRR